MPEIWAEVWTRPGDPNYGRRIASPPLSEGSATIGFSGVGQGSMTLPKSYIRLDDILKTDPDTPANGVSSTVKIFSESQADPIYEWLPGALIPAQSKNDPNVSINGDGIEAIVGYGQVEPWDWDGSANFVSSFPDWIYGGRNLLSNPGFEDSPCRPEVNEVIIDATVSGGTFTLSDGTDTTSAIAFNASPSTIENELEADIAAIDDVNVTGSGAPDDPYVITFITPCEFPGGLIFDGSSLTPAPGDSDLFRTQFGALIPSPWTKSMTVSDGTPVVHGDYVSFRVTTAEAHSGTYSLLIDPAPIGRRFAGAQQIVDVQPHGTYTPDEIWVKTNSASQEYRFVIRGIDEDLLLDINGNPALLQQTLTSGVWTLFTIPTVNTEDNSQVIVRIANINVSGNPAIFYVDDGSLAEGVPAATVGKMWGDLYAAWTDPVLRAPIVWDDGTTTDTPYLTNDFTDTLDSAGAAWADTHSLTFRPRMTGLQVLAEFVRLGYQWRVVPGVLGPTPTPGYYLLQIYNPATMGATQPAGIQTGAADIRRNARYLTPKATQVTVQGQAFLSSRAQDAGLLAAFGRIEGSTLDLNITSTVDAALAASDGVASNNQGASSLVYTLRPYAGISEPLVAYRPADEITIMDPGVAQGQRQVSQIELAWDKTGVEYTIYLGSVALVGQTAVNQAVYDLLTRFQRADEIPSPASVQFSGGSGAPTVVIAAPNSSGISQGKADFIFGQTISLGGLHQLMESLAGVGARILWTEGDHLFGSDQLVVPQGIDFEGMGESATRLTWGGAPDAVFGGNNGIRHLSFRDNSS